MYNLLISADENAWEKAYYEYDKKRIFEYTPEYFKNEYISFSEEALNRLKKIPTLFIHEMFEGKSKIGYIKEIKQNYENCRITMDYLFNISSTKLSHIRSELDLGNWEISRTHWAVKDIDLLHVLQDKKILSNEQVSYFNTPKYLPDIQFDIAFSFPGEKRELISKIVDNLKARKKYSIFYDKDFVEQLAVPDMDLLLMNVYKKQSKLICILLSKEYQNKKWCQLEWKSVREIILERKYSIMFFRYDNAVIDGVSSNDGYIDVTQHSPDQIATFIQKRLKSMEQGDV